VDPLSRRHYIDNAPTTTLTGSINASTTSIVVASLTGYPTSFPYPVTLGMGTASAEQILVNSAVGTTLTVVRNANGLGAFSHPAGENFNHTANAVEYDEANAHVNASTGVHGITGAVVGTTDAQTLSNKTFSNAIFAATGGVPGATYTTAATSDNGWVLKNPSAVIVAKVDGNGLATVASLSVTNNATVGGTLTVTGATTAAAITSSATVTGSSIVSNNDVTASTGRFTSTGAGSAASTTHAFQAGATNAGNVIIDTSHIYARNNGVFAALGINTIAGDVNIASAGANTNVNGFLHAFQGVQVDGALTTVITKSTAIGTIASGFSVQTQIGRKLLNGKVIDITLAITRTGATLTATNNNIADTLCFTITDASYRPLEARQIVFVDAGQVNVLGTINTDGTVTLRTATFDVTSGDALVGNCTYVID
jgi:hypothetical protein